MARDPIVDSSPARQPLPLRRLHELTSSDYEDELVADFTTQPTLPLTSVSSRFFTRAQTPPRISQPSTFVTQPTQLLQPATPSKNQESSQVQVAASSPMVQRTSQPPPVSQRQLAIAPRGTCLRPPPAVPRPAPVDFSDDPPIQIDSDEDNAMGSNIRPSVFETGNNRVSRVSRISRIAETPQKRTMSLSSFAYQPSNAQKRKAADLLSNVDKKPRANQNGPARALPITSDTVMLADVVDHEVRHNIHRLHAFFPKYTLDKLRDLLHRNQNNYEMTFQLLKAELQARHRNSPVVLSDDELQQSPPKMAVKQPTAKREVKAPAKTIQEKFSTIQQSAAVTQEEVVPKKRGRLIRGRRNPTPPRNTTAKQPIVIEDKSDDEDEGIVLDPDTDSDAESSDGIATDTDGLLKYFNECSVEAMADLSNQKEDVVRAVFAHRPFRSLAAIEKISLDAPGKKKSRAVPIGEKLVDYASSMWTGYKAVDRLVSQCENMGKPIAAAMAKWGVNIFGVATEGVALTSLDNKRDSGIGSPKSDSDADTPSQRPKKGDFVGKPAIMADDIELKDYQLVGLNWLCLLWKHQMSCILADDMGLGKTCQVIAFLSQLHELGVEGPHLIVVPGSTLENWLREFNRFSPKLAVEPYYGAQADRATQADTILANADSIDVVVTTYDLAFKAPDNKFLRKLKPTVCVFDEGHVLRNSQTQRYKSLMRIPARMRVLLTGTPLQNNLRELASVLAFIMPNVFQQLEEDLAFVFKHKAKTTDQDHAALLSAQRITRARSMMAPFVLRRKKTQVLHHLPQKISRVEYCELTETQKTLYAEQLDKQRKVLLERAAGTNPKDSTNVMMRLRQAAIHPLLFRHHYDDETIAKMSKSCLKEPIFAESNPNLIFEELQQYQDYQCHQMALKYPKHLGRYGLKNEEWMDSGKIKKLVELLKRFKENGDRTLIFSQFTSVMDILEWVLGSINMEFFRLDGQTPIAQRQDMLDEFYKDTSIPVFMLSTKSGGAGINLACANKVIIFDSSFNPQDDRQAEDRAHRVGQTRDVEVIRLVSRGTVEEQIHALGISKLELDKLVAGDEVAKKAAKDEPSAADLQGIHKVEEMLLEQLKNEAPTDLKDQFLNGLKNRGLDMSAA